MTLDEYKIAATFNNFDEFPKIIGPGMTMMESFIDYTQSDLDLKIHLVAVSLNRNFSSADGHEVMTDHYWVLDNFMASCEKDLIRPWLTEPIKEAISMILSGQAFTKYIIGTAFMFGIIEFYAKYLLGYKPMEANFFDDKFHEPYRNMSVAEAMNKLKKTNSYIAKALNKIDKRSITRLKEAMIEEKDWAKPRIADRLGFYRNVMLHGESHSHYSIGKYLCMLYILFHQCYVKQLGQTA